MILEIPFNVDIYKRQTNLQLDIQWNKILRKSKKNLFFSIGLFLFGALAVYGKGNVGYVFIIFGIYGFIQFYKINAAYQKTKKEFQKIVSDEIKGQVESNENSIWEFNEEYFRYKDYKYDSKINWDAFKSYRIIEDNIFLDLNVGNQLSYVIGKEEIGENSYLKIIKLLDDKIKRTSP